MRQVVFAYRFFVCLGVIAATFVMSSLWEPLFLLASLLLLGVVVATIYEYLILRKLADRSSVQRSVDQRLSLSDFQQIDYNLVYTGDRHLLVTLTDELPYQLQDRRPIAEALPITEGSYDLSQSIRPVVRGDYNFGCMRLYVQLRRPGLLQYMREQEQEQTVPVYPSIIQMRRYALMIFEQTALKRGIRRIRQVGENDEFEHLRQYQQGDNIKSINWKATSRKGELIVNQYQDTRSQSVYCILDKGRTMEMPFEGMSLLDYSINTILTISNIALRKYDKAGLVTFGTEVSTSLAAENFPHQLEQIASILYREQALHQEAGFEALLHFVRRRVQRRGIVFLFTNFEAPSDLDRAMPYLRAISRKHLLIVIAFRNAELDRASEEPVEDDLDYYVQTLAADYKYQKHDLMQRMQLQGIHTIYTTPADLSVDVINKYLEIKARRLR